MTVKNTDKCIACDSEVNLDQEGHEKYYCSFCSTKREEFTDTINGEINIGQVGSPARAHLMILENLRKSIFKVWLYKRVDSLFSAMSGANISVELYENER